MAYGDYTSNVFEEKDGSWTVQLVQWSGVHWVKRAETTITGFFAGWSYWFKPMEKRVEIASKRLMDAEIRRIAKLRREDALTDISRSFIGRP